MSNRANLSLLYAVARHLRPVLGDVMFVGGVVTVLLLTDSAAPEVRATSDVDITVELASYGRFQTFVDTLFRLGYHLDSQGHTGRFRGHGRILDVMPSTPVLGETNSWYAPAFAWAQSVALEGGLAIRVISAPYFLATKIEAFNGRGRHDPFYSKDFTDIVSVLDGRSELVAEVAVGQADLRAFLTREARSLLGEGDLEDWLSAALPPDRASQARAPLVLERLGTLGRL